MAKLETPLLRSSKDGTDRQPENLLMIKTRKQRLAILGTTGLLVLTFAGLYSGAGVPVP